MHGLQPCQAATGGAQDQPAPADLRRLQADMPTKIVAEANRRPGTTATTAETPALAGLMSLRTAPALAGQRLQAIRTAPALAGLMSLRPSLLGVVWHRLQPLYLLWHGLQPLYLLRNLPSAIRR